LRYLIKVENEIKSQVSYYFTEKNGENQKEYLDIANDNYVGKKNPKCICCFRRIYRLKSAGIIRASTRAK
jgi:hypothetical protein